MATTRIEGLAGLEAGVDARAPSWAGAWARWKRPLGLLPILAGFWALLVPVAGLLSAVALGPSGPSLGLEGGATSAVVVTGSALGLAASWSLLGRFGLEPSAPAKLSLAFVILALACLALAVGLEWALVDGRVSPLALGGCLLGLALALQCAGPASLRAVLTDLDGSRRARASGVGIWLASAGLGSLAGVLRLGPGRVRVADLELVLERCIDLGLLAIVAAVMLALCWRRLARPVSHAAPASASSVAARSMIAS